MTQEMILQKFSLHKALLKIQITTSFQTGNMNMMKKVIF